MSDAELPDEKTVTTSDGEEVTIRETVNGVTVSASCKKQLEQYEPISEHVTYEAEKPGELSAEQFDAWVEGLADLAFSEAERGVLARWEQHVREESFGDD